MSQVVCCCRALLVFACVGWLAPCLPAEDARNPPDFQALGRPFIEKYCLRCHNDEKHEADLSLSQITDIKSIEKFRKPLVNALRLINSHEMPPADELQPDAQESEQFRALLLAAIDYVDRHAAPDPGRVTMRRLNRVEYRNTIRDLVGVDFDPTEDFPADDIGHGFDNIGDVLTLSPVLMERYLSAAENIMARAITPEPPPIPKRHQSGRYLEPASGEVEKNQMAGNYRWIASGATEPIVSGPLHTPYKWNDDGEYIFRARVYIESDSEQPARIGVFVNTRGETPAAQNTDDVASLAGRLPSSARLVETLEVNERKADQSRMIEVRLPAEANRDRVYVGLFMPAEGQSQVKLFVEYFELEGPLDPRPASHRRLLATTQSVDPAAMSQEVVARFLRLAFRRPPSAEELERYLAFAKQRQTDGAKWEAAMQEVFQAILCSPKFLFRVELDDRPNALEQRPIDEYQLASRLSYFLWSSMPDEELLLLAERGELTKQLDSQIERMLRDERANQLIDNFVMQWLQLQRLQTFAPDSGMFPQFSPVLRRAMFEETSRFVASIMTEDRSVLDMIDADFTYLNETLAKHYGIADTVGNRVGQADPKPGGEPIQGREFRRVTLQDRRRGGLLTQASVLTVTSNPTRTSPVKRGRWVLEQILGEPPPPPPPNVPELPNDQDAVAGGTLRQRLEIHRSNPSCANCHAKMDPIGFALENFDAIGAYREKDGNFPIDSAGEFADGTPFKDAADLKQIVRQKKDLFVRCLTEKLLTYALGRGVEYYDRPTIEQIVAKIEQQDYRFSALVKEIVRSDAFRLRRGLDDSAAISETAPAKPIE